MAGCRHIKHSVLFHLLSNTISRKDWIHSLSRTISKGENMTSPEYIFRRRTKIHKLTLRLNPERSYEGESQLERTGAGL